MNERKESVKAFLDCGYLDKSTLFRDIKICFPVLWEGAVFTDCDIDLHDMKTEEMKGQIDRLVFENISQDDMTDEERFRTSAKIQALVQLCDPVGHVTKGLRRDPSRWQFPFGYYLFAANFHGVHASRSLDVQGIVAGKYRAFDETTIDPETVN